MELAERQFQPFLRFYMMKNGEILLPDGRFQPFLRFYRSCWAVFRVFKFFGPFLEPRRPPSDPALRSKIAALGVGGAPFFAAAQRSSG